MGVLFKKGLGPKVVFVVGPTASGKSQWALSLAQEFSGAIINGDSLQFYQGMDIGTSKPSLSERALVPHYLFDRVPVGGASVTAGQFRQWALEVLERGEHPLYFVVGGSGFYLKALEKGMFPVDAIAAPVRSRVRELMVSGSAYKTLQSVDPHSAKVIKPQDNYRVSRALEVFYNQGVPLSQLRRDFFVQSGNNFPYRYKKLGIAASKANLQTRVHIRVDQMLGKGLVKEVQGLLLALQEFPQGASSWAPLQSIGYKEVVEGLEQNWSEAQMAEAIIQNTMRLVKKQNTWFARDDEIIWRSWGDDDHIIHSVLQKWL